TSDLGFPRTRGDAPAVVRRSSGSDTFPPHARGCTPRHLRGSVSPRVSPARAGMHRDIPWYCLGVHGFPRTRGDAPATHLISELVDEFPPHARGCTVVAVWRYIV